MGFPIRFSEIGKQWARSLIPLEMLSGRLMGLHARTSNGGIWASPGERDQFRGAACLRVGMICNSQPVFGSWLLRPGTGRDPDQRDPACLVAVSSCSHAKPRHRERLLLVGVGSFSFPVTET